MDNEYLLNFFKKKNVPIIQKNSSLAHEGYES